MSKPKFKKGDRARVIEHNIVESGSIVEIDEDSARAPWCKIIEGDIKEDRSEHFLTRVAIDQSKMELIEPEKPEFVFQWKVGDKYRYKGDKKTKLTMNYLINECKWSQIEPRGKKTKARYQAWLDEQERAKQPKFKAGEYARFNQDYGSIFKEGQVVEVTDCDETMVKFESLDTVYNNCAWVGRLDKHEYRAGDWVEFINNGHHMGRKGQKVQVKSIDAEGDLWITGISRAENCTHPERVKPCAEPEPVDIWEGVEYATGSDNIMTRSTQYLTKKYGSKWKVDSSWKPVKLKDCTAYQLRNLIEFDLSLR